MASDDRQAIIEELYSRRDTLPADKRAIVEELRTRLGQSVANQPQEKPAGDDPDFMSRFYETTIGNPIELIKKLSVPGNTAIHDIGKGLLDRYLAADPGGHGVFGKLANTLGGPIVEPIAEDIQAGRYGAAAGGVAGNVAMAMSPQIVSGAGRAAVKASKAVKAAPAAAKSAVAAAREVISTPGTMDIAAGTGELLAGASAASHGHFIVGSGLGAAGLNKLRVGMSARKAYQLQKRVPGQPAELVAKEAPAVAAPAASPVAPAAAPAVERVAAVADDIPAVTPDSEIEAALAESLRRAKDKRFNPTPPAQVKALDRGAKKAAKDLSRDFEMGGRSMKVDNLSGFLEKYGVDADSAQRMSDAQWRTVTEQANRELGEGTAKMALPSEMTRLEVIRRLKRLEKTK